MKWSFYKDNYDFVAMFNDRNANYLLEKCVAHDLKQKVM